MAVIDDLSPHDQALAAAARRLNMTEADLDAARQQLDEAVADLRRLRRPPDPVPPGLARAIESAGERVARLLDRRAEVVADLADLGAAVDRTVPVRVR